MAEHRIKRRRRWPWLVAGVPALVIVLLVAAWGVAAHARGDAVARNVTLAGKDVGGMDRATLAQLVDQFADDERTTPVHISTNEHHDYDTTASALGLALNKDATADAVLAFDRSGFAPLRPFQWAASFLKQRTVSPRFTIDSTVLAAALPDLEGENRTPPTEPSIGSPSPGAITVSAGQPGHGIDAARLAGALLAVAPHHAPGVPIEVHVDEAAIPPTFTDAQAQTVADEATRLARQQLTVTVNSKSKPVDVATVAMWFRAVPHDGALQLAIDPAVLKLTVTALFGAIGEEPADASFSIEDGKPVLHPGHDGTTCCEDTAPAAILRALRANQSAVTIGLVARHPALTTEHAQQLGIVEEVGQPDTFGPTTHHACCEGRVTNIHKIADIVRGHVVLPGETFSVNGFVGQRTKDRGFVDAPVIYNATHDHDIGGGVSQFATTMFNAAFFAGLDLTEYQSHSLYISRYPRGREATISWPAPDLKITNSTPYGILIWPTYDATSLTVHLFSTHFVDVEAQPTTDARAGRCTRVTTPRLRTYVDGHTAQDKVSALYQPADGVRC
jgi:vancomycin resistance protein YoaR